jgi:hypothetical protein
MTPAVLGSPATVASLRDAPCSDLLVRWRLGRGGVLVVRVATSEPSAAPCAAVCMTARVEIEAHGVRGIGPCGAFEAAVEPCGDEVSVRIDLGDAGIAAMRLVTRAETGDVVVVTDLPERLGLRGGTYVLESCGR